MHLKSFWDIFAQSQCSRQPRLNNPPNENLWGEQREKTDQNQHQELWTRPHPDQAQSADENGSRGREQKNPEGREHHSKRRGTGKSSGAQKTKRTKTAGGVEQDQQSQAGYSSADGAEQDQQS